MFCKMSNNCSQKFKKALTRTNVCVIIAIVIRGGSKMVDILKSKGIICFFLFIIVMGVLSSNSLNYMNDNKTNDSIVVMVDTIK